MEDTSKGKEEVTSSTDAREEVDKEAGVRVRVSKEGDVELLEACALLRADGRLKRPGWCRRNLYQYNRVCAVSLCCIERWCAPSCRSRLLLGWASFSEGSLLLLYAPTSFLLRFASLRIFGITPFLVVSHLLSL